MFGAWVIFLWLLVGVVFLVKLAPTRRVVSAMRQQPLLVQTVAVLTLCLAVIYGSSKPTNENALVQSPSPLNVNASASLQQAAESSGLPAWWQGNDTDTDEDGIPDQWERWTHGDPATANESIDRDAGKPGDRRGCQHGIAIVPQGAIQPIQRHARGGEVGDHARLQG